jgi:hypothetical protein
VVKSNLPIGFGIETAGGYSLLHLSIENKIHASEFNIEKDAERNKAE